MGQDAAPAFGPFEILHEIGRGASSRVYLAKDTRLSRQVALKVLVPGDDDVSDANALVREARAAAALQHPNIATIFELVEDNGHFAVAMEYVEGETLAHRLEPDERLELNVALEVVQQVAAGLEHAHAKGIVHGDLKPSNLMLGADDQVKVLDFGLGSWFRTHSRGDTAAELMGTPGFIAPELLNGATAGPRADLFALGVVLYRSITGVLPFDGESPSEIFHATATQEPERLDSYRSDVPLELETLMRRALAKQPEGRYQSATELLRELAVAQSTQQRNRDRGAPSQEVTEVVPEGPYGWLRRLFRLPRKEGMEAPDEAREPRVAFRGLRPFVAADNDCFFGRDVESAALVERLHLADQAFLVLSGPSGCGKTSLLQAGIFPRLLRDGLLPVYHRPVWGMEALVRELAKQSQLDCEPGESPADYIRRVVGTLGCGVVLVCDQFEELCVQTSEAERRGFLALVAEVQKDPETRVKLLVSVRQDFWYHVHNAFTDIVADPLRADRLVQLDNFDSAQAREVLESTRRWAGVAMEPALVNQVVKDLAKERVVLPSELQILGHQLQHKAITTRDAYRAAGGKESLMHAFLEDAIRSSREPDRARLLLHALISEADTRVTLSLDELVERSGLPKQSVDELLSHLASFRLVLQIQDREPWRYELMHEYLVEKIQHAAGRILGKRERANRLFRQHLGNQVLHKSARIPLRELWQVWRHSDLPRGEAEQELLGSSLRRGLARAGAVAFLLVAAGVMLAALSSRRVEWQEQRLRDGHTAAVRKAAVSPDGQRLVSVGEDAAVMVWDLPRRRRLTTLRAHGAAVNDVAYSPNGDWFVTASSDGTVKLWDSITFAERPIFQRLFSRAYAVAASSDGQLVAASGLDQDVGDYASAVASVADGELLRRFADGAEYGTLLFLNNTAQLLIPPRGTLAGLSGEVVGALRRLPERGYIGAALSPDDGLLGTVDSDGEVRFWDPDALWHGGDAVSLAAERIHHDHGRTVTFSPDGKLMVSGAEDMVLWDVARRERIDRLTYPAIVWSAAFTADGKELISTHGDGSILLWDPVERQLVGTFDGHAGPVRAVAFSPDGRLLASASEDRSIIVWDLATMRKRAVLSGHDSRVNSVAFSPDGSLVASCGQRQKLIVHELRTERVYWEKTESLICYTVVFSPDGRLVAGSEAVWSVEDGTLVGPIARHLEAAAFSPKGRYLARGGTWVQLWDTKTWELEVYERVESPIAALDFHPSEPTFVTGEVNGEIRVWSLDPLEPGAVVGRHDARVKSVKFLPDGKHVVSAADDQKLLLWDVDHRRLKQSIGFHASPVLAVAVSPDGTRLATGEHDHSVRLYSRRRTLWGWDLDKLWQRFAQ